MAPSSRPRPGQRIASGRRATGPGDPLRAPPVPVSKTNGPCALASAWQARWPRDSQSHRPPRPNADDAGTLSTARGQHGLPREPQCAPGASSGEGRGRAPRPPRYLGSAQQAGHQPDGLQVALRQQQLPLLRADLLLQPALPLRLQLLQLPLAAARLAVPLLLLALAQLLLALPLPLQLLQLLLLPARNTAASGGRRVLRGRRHRRHAQRWGAGRCRAPTCVNASPVRTRPGSPAPRPAHTAAGGTPCVRGSLAQRARARDRAPKLTSQGDAPAAAAQATAEGGQGHHGAHCHHCQGRGGPRPPHHWPGLRPGTAEVTGGRSQVIDEQLLTQRSMPEPAPRGGEVGAGKSPPWGAPPVRHQGNRGDQQGQKPRTRTATGRFRDVTWREDGTVHLPREPLP